MGIILSCMTASMTTNPIHYQGLPQPCTLLKHMQTYASLGEHKSTSCQKIEGNGLNIYRENESNPSGEALIMHANESVHKSNIMIPSKNLQVM